MPVVDCEQGTAQWLAERVGRITASRIGEALSKYKSEKKANVDNAERYNYKIDLIAERLTGRSTENFTSPEMLWGVEHEDDARSDYEMEKDVMCERVGFIVHPQFDWSGASPDSLVGRDGGHEIKAPKTATHIKWLRAGIVPPEHLPQVNWNIECSEREWWDFHSYDPRLPRGLRSFIVRHYRDEAALKVMRDEAARFNDEVEAVIAELRQRVKPAPEPDPAPEIEDWHRHFGEEIVI